jgi:hypothetical protein
MSVALSKHLLRYVSGDALVGAGILSTLIFPIVAVRLRGDSYEPPDPGDVEDLEQPASSAVVA